MFRTHAHPARPGTLGDLAAGASARLTSIDAGTRDVKRLLELGVGVGTTLTVARHRGPNVLVACGAGRVAIGPELARRMQVEAIRP